MAMDPPGPGTAAVTVLSIPEQAWAGAVGRGVPTAGGPLASTTEATTKHPPHQLEGASSGLGRQSRLPSSAAAETRSISDSTSRGMIRLANGMNHAPTAQPELHDRPETPARSMAWYDWYHRIGVGTRTTIPQRRNSPVSRRLRCSASRSRL